MVKLQNGCQSLLESLKEVFWDHFFSSSTSMISAIHLLPPQSLSSSSSPLPCMLMTQKSVKEFYHTAKAYQDHEIFSILSRSCCLTVRQFGDHFSNGSKGELPNTFLTTLSLIINQDLFNVLLRMMFFYVKNLKDPDP